MEKKKGGREWDNKKKIGQIKNMFETILITVLQAT